LRAGRTGKASVREGFLWSHESKSSGRFGPRSTPTTAAKSGAHDCPIRTRPLTSGGAMQILMSNRGAPCRGRSVCKRLAARLIRRSFAGLCVGKYTLLAIFLPHPQALTTSACFCARQRSAKGAGTPSGWPVYTLFRINHLLSIAGMAEIGRRQTHGSLEA